MTVTFDPAMLPQMPCVAASPESTGQAESAIGFANLLETRALLDAPAAATSARLSSETPGAFAPVALPFNEAPLFGQVFLDDRRKPVAEGVPLLSQTAARLVAAQGPLPDLVPMEPVAADAALAAETDRPLGLQPRSQDPEFIGRGDAVRIFREESGYHQRGSSAGEASSKPPIGAATSTPASLPLVIGPSRMQVGESNAEPSILAGGSPVTLGGRSGAMVRLDASPAPPLVPVRTSGARLAGHASFQPDESAVEKRADRAQDARARFIDQLGPVHLLVRPENSALYLTARVAALPADKEEVLERRLREAMAEEGLSLAGLKINGQVWPTAAGS